jgi:hypothetical protein
VNSKQSEGEEEDSGQKTDGAPSSDGLLLFFKIKKPLGEDSRNEDSFGR